jgi:hypothetical protein
MKKKMFWLINGILLLGVVLSACAAQSESSTVGYEIAPEAPAMDYKEYVEEEFASDESGFNTGSGETGGDFERMVIYNANLQIAVVDPLAAMDAVISMADKSNGYVVRSEVYRTSSEKGSLPTISMTIRVPAGQLDPIMDSIKNLTPNPKEDVLSENVSGQDVTSEFTDLGSRLKNLEAAEAQLTELMDKAEDAEDVLAIFNELTYYRGEIEVVKGRMKYLEESAAMSAITVEITAKTSIQPVTVEEWNVRGTFKRAVEALVEAVQWIVDAAIWLGIYCLPFLIPLGAAVYFSIRIYKKQKAKQQAEKEGDAL